MAERFLFDGNGAVAEGVRLAAPTVIAVYPITPQTPVTAHLSTFIREGRLSSRYVEVESEHSALSVCNGASATGVRTFTATSSQGLAYMYEMVYMTAGQRLPVVMYVVNRSLAMPTSLQAEHNDALSTRDSGWILLHCESAQELLDTTIQAYRIAEDPRVLLPVLFCADGFLVSHTAESVELPDAGAVATYLPPYRPEHTYLDPGRPMFVGVAPREMNVTEYRYNMHRAMRTALEVIEEAGDAYGRLSGRSYGLIDCLAARDAEYLFLTLGSMAGTARVAVSRLRARGIRAGLIRLRAVRPFPAQSIYDACPRCRVMAVVERSTSIGSPHGSGCLYPEIVSVFYGKKRKPIIRPYIAGLAGRYVGVEDFERVCAEMQALGARRRATATSGVQGEAGQGGACTSGAGGVDGGCQAWETEWIRLVR
jgi:pyruvate ferredoxin oxidoreductase alpha subunit